MCEEISREKTRHGVERVGQNECQFNSISHSSRDTTPPSSSRHHHHHHHVYERTHSEWQRLTRLTRTHTHRYNETDRRALSCCNDDTNWLHVRQRQSQVSFFRFSFSHRDKQRTSGYKCMQRRTVASRKMSELMRRGRGTDENSYSDLRLDARVSTRMHPATQLASIVQ